MTLKNDIPVFSSDDKYEREKFAGHITNMLMQIIDQRDMVVGIVGPWGTGKTSLWNMVNEKIEKNFSEKCKTKQFNPWVFSDTAALLTDLFQTISITLDLKDRISLAKYLSKAVPLVKLAKYIPGTEPFADIVETASEHFQNYFNNDDTFENLKRKIETSLKDNTVKLIIFIDDLDRLEPAEVLSIIKAVKLLANFKNISFVLSYDASAITTIINTAFGKDNKDTFGNLFLEKIVQLQINVPPVSNQCLIEELIENIEFLLNGLEEKLLKEEIKRIAEKIYEYFGDKIVTPRISKLYYNYISLAISCKNITGEIDVKELIILEGLRLFYPTIYSNIWRHKNKLIKGINTKNNNFDNDKLFVALLGEDFLGDLEAQEKDKLQHIILPAIFPKLKKPILASETLLIQNKSIATYQYFDRYFQYNVAKNAISDKEIKNFIDSIENCCSSEILKSFAAKNKLDLLVTNLYHNFSKLASIQEKIFTTLFITNETIIRDTCGSFYTASNAFFYVNKLDSFKRKQLLYQVIDNSSLGLAYDIFMQVKQWNIETVPTDSYINQDDLDEIKKKLLIRILNEIHSDYLLKNNLEYKIQLYSFVLNYADSNEKHTIDELIQRKLFNNHDDIYHFLNGFFNKKGDGGQLYIDNTTLENIDKFIQIKSLLDIYNKNRNEMLKINSEHCKDLDVFFERVRNNAPSFLDKDKAIQGSVKKVSHFC